MWREQCAPWRLGYGGTYQRDGLGSITRISDASQNPVNTYAYDPWGMTTASGSLANPFQYTGRERDPASSLYHYRARGYDPEARRFLQKDPAGMVDGTNLYAYVGNNPVNRVDPSGAGTTQYEWARCWGTILLIFGRTACYYCCDVELTQCALDCWENPPGLFNYCLVGCQMSAQVCYLACGGREGPRPMTASTGDLR